MKKTILMIGSVIACVSSLQYAQAEQKAPHPLKNLTFIISYLDDTDPFYTDIFSGIEEMKKEGELQQFDVINYDGDRSKLRTAFDQSLQNSDAIIMDLIPGEYINYYVEQAEKKDIPLVFAFVKPPPQILSKNPNVFYIAQDEFQSGVSQGLLVSQYVAQHPETDKNGDGILSIINIAGVGTDTDSEKERFAWQLNTIDNYPGSQLSAEEIANYPAFYNYQKAYDYIAELAANKTLEQAEVIIAQSDNMARAAADALEKSGYRLPVFSRGISPEGEAYIKSGKIQGTVQSSPFNVGYYAAKMAYNYANGLDPNNNIPYQIYKSKIELPYHIVTAENL